jgi:hypothetical protein
MQRCPKCGYRQRLDWPSVLPGISFCILYVLLMLTEGYLPRVYRIWVDVICFLAFLLFLTGTWWRGYRARMEEIEHSRQRELQKLN